jgi:hypothetical protein
VIIEAAGDGHRGAVDQLPSGPVGLPALVGPGEGEPFSRRPRSLPRLRDDQAVTAQDPGHRRPRRHRGHALALQCPHDRLRSVIEPGAEQLDPTRDHRAHHLGIGGHGARHRPPGPVLRQPFPALGQKPLTQLVERDPADLMAAAELRHVLDLAGQRRCGTNIHRRHLLGHEPLWVHPARSGVSDVPRHTPVSDVLRLHMALTATGHAEIARSGTVNPAAASSSVCLRTICAVTME